jgi:hypothetical protein
MMFRMIGRIIKVGAVSALMVFVASIGAAAALDHLPSETDPTAIASDDALAVIADTILRDIEKTENDGGAVCLGRRDIRAPINEDSLLPLPVPVVAFLRNQTYNRPVAFKPRCGDYKLVLELVTLVQVGTPPCEVLQCAAKCAHDECRSIFHDQTGGAGQHQQEYLTEAVVRFSTSRSGTIVFKIVTADGRLKEVLRDPDENWGGS